MYFTYIILCRDGSFYTGISTDPDRRFKEHKNKKGGKYTYSHPVKKVIYSEQFETKGEALRRERQIKGWRREKKIKILNLPLT
jgi:putative endonuclease